MTVMMIPPEPMAQRKSWDQYFIDMTYNVAERATCLRKKVGCILVKNNKVIATGYNGAPRNFKHCTEVGCIMFDGHCIRTIHAEQNVLLQTGSNAEGATMYCTSLSCDTCFKQILQVGIRRFVYIDEFGIYTIDNLKYWIKNSNIILEKWNEKTLKLERKTFERIYYLAHPSRSRDSIREWQLKIQQKNLGITFINPFFEGQIEEKILVEKLLETGTIPNLTNTQCKTIVDNDLDIIEKTDGVVAVIDGNLSYGTIMEIVYAYQLQKPVYLICTNKQQNHPWLQYHSTQIFTTFEQFEEWLDG